MRPRGQPFVSPPAGAGYKSGIIMSLLFQEWGLWELAVNTDTGLKAWDRVVRTICRMQPPRDGMLMICQLKSARAVPTQYNTFVYQTDSDLTGNWGERPDELFGPRTVDPSVMVISDPLALLREPRPGVTPPVVADSLFAGVGGLGGRRGPRAAIRETATSGVRTRYDPKLDDPPKDPARPHFDPGLDDEIKF
jgi:hypothetical protein